MSKILRSHVACLALALALACAAAVGCKEECPPTTVQSGKLCLFKHDAAVGMDSVAANGGSGAGNTWSCNTIGLACVCNQSVSAGVSGPGCSAPLPPCCFTSADASGATCACWPSDSPECVNAQSGQPPGTALVASCPPP